MTEEEIVRREEGILERLYKPSTTKVEFPFHANDAGLYNLTIYADKNTGEFLLYKWEFESAKDVIHQSPITSE
jgi:hypothetical protein